jgi:hypothetical protein
MTQASDSTPARTIEEAFRGYLGQRGSARLRARKLLLEHFQTQNSGNAIDRVASDTGYSSEEVHLALASLLNDGLITVNADYGLAVTDSSGGNR